MPTGVAVTRVTVEFSSSGKPFRLVFTDTSKLSAIVFSKTDFDRLTTMQNTLANLGSGVKPAREHFFEASRQIAATTATGEATLAPQLVGGASPEPATEVSVEPFVLPEQSLWWHSTECVWIHPMSFET